MRFAPTMDAVSTHRAPAWYNNAKLGIFIHWGAYAVPAFAPPTCQLGEAADDEWWALNNPYSEWYQNKLRLGQGPTWEYHLANYGPEYPYERFFDEWRAERWDPDQWAGLFRRSGARYVVPVTKHHDGLCLWNSRHTQLTTVVRGPKRDIIEQLAAAVRAQGMRLGLYYSGLLDWSFTSDAIWGGPDCGRPQNCTYAYADYAYKQCLELVDTYRPSILWNDMGWPHKGLDDLPNLFAHYYNTVPDGLVNDRWSGVWHDFTTKEYKAGEGSLAHKWEMCRGLGLSFGYNAAEDASRMVSGAQLVSLLVETVAGNGNLLLNVGPRADGTIPQEQAARLLYLGQWLDVYGDGIYGTRPWIRQAETAENGVQLYYTQKDGHVSVFLDGLPAGASTTRVAGMAPMRDSLRPPPGFSVAMEAQGSDLLVHLRGLPQGQPAVGLL